MSDSRKDTGAIMAEFDRVLSGVRAGIVGTKIQASGRTFEAVAVAPYKRRSDGADSLLVTWKGECRTCTEPYTVKGSRNATHLPVNCPEHRGRRTRHGKKSRSRAIGAQPATLQLECEGGRPVRAAVIAGDERIAVVSLESIAACAVNVMQAGVAAGSRAEKK